MKKTKLIAAIRETILDLQLNRKKYDFNEATQCNCGILARNLLEMSAGELKNRGVDRSWSLTIFRMTTLPIIELYERLSDAGVSKEQMNELEDLNNPEILKEAGGRKFQRNDKNHLILYFQAWLRILEREEKVKETEKVKDEAPQVISSSSPLPVFSPLPALPMQYVKAEQMELKIYQN